MVREGASADGAAAVGEANVGGTGNAAALSPRQELAVREIVRGRSVTAAAHAAGVSRQTVYRWMAEPPFAATLNRWLAEMKELAQDQLYGAAVNAAGTLAAAIEAGDVKAAVVLLHGLGILAPPGPEAPGSDDPAILARQVELDRRAARVAPARREADLAETELMTGLSREASAKS